jgi:prolyl oligopeptidase
MRRARLTPFVTALLPALALARALPPAAPIHPVTNVYWGTPVVDDYRWMEKPGSKRLAAWMKAQNAYTRSILDSMPGHRKLLDEISRASNSTADTGGVIRAGRDDFNLQTGAGQDTAKLYVRVGKTGATRLLVDPNRFGRTGVPAAVNFFEPSNNGRYVAYGVSLGGSEAATLRVMDTETGRDMGVSIDRIDGDNDGFPPVWWLPDGRSFAYYRLQKLTKADPASAFFQKSRVFLHRLGEHPTGAGDTPLFGYEVTPAVPVGLDQDSLVVTVPGSPYAFGVLTENEDMKVIDAIYASPVKAVMAGRPVWKPLVGKADHVAAFDARGSRIYLLTYRDAPRFKIVSTDIAAPDLAHATVVLPQSQAVIKSFGVAADALYVRTTLDGMSRIERLPYGAAGPEQVALPFAGTAAGPITNPALPGALFSLSSWVKPAVIYAYDPDRRRLANTGIQPPSTAEVHGVESREVQAVSYDGTRVPLSIIMRSDTRLDGRNPTLLIGYGSYGITISPEFVGRYLPWIQRGGILAFAHVRGGGWYGEAWHEAGQKLTKLNTVDDFIACADYLVNHGYTSPRELAGAGGSAGGITIGRAIEMRPDLFAAAIDWHGLSDTLRAELEANGPPNIVEFGSVKTEAGFHGLYAMSPYVHVRDGVHYPAVLLETGANDPRVDPWEMAKMTARLQAATRSGNPILLRVSYESGHGVGSTKGQRNRELDDELSFLLWRFGDPAFQPAVE